VLQLFHTFSSFSFHRLQQEPENVTVISLESLSPRTVRLSKRHLVFTPDNWDEPQFVNITAGVLQWVVTVF
jgi:glycyl-tRNA synthetase alpha subunit